MDWVSRFQLFLFDFDGLLVDTERLHYRSYVEVLSRRGYPLPFTLVQFFQYAHLNATAWKEALCAKIEGLSPHWEEIYAEKKRTYLDLLFSGKVELMPGVSSLLEALLRANIGRCVVTHAQREQVELICSHLPILQTIPHWITREDYRQPKPHPECYLKAIALYSRPGDKVIGFEDSIRGWTALRQTAALPILICPQEHPLLPTALKEGALHFPSLEKIKRL